MPSLSRRQTLFGAAILAAGLPSLAFAQSAPKPAAKSPAASVTYREMIYGDPKAKVVMMEYGSLACSHCAQFANDIFPAIKKNYIDTGKIRFVFRDYPIWGHAMAAAVITRCAPGDNGKQMVEALFKEQEKWTASKDLLATLKEYAARAGLSSADVEACLENEKLIGEMQAEIKKAEEVPYGVRSTPTFFIGDEKVEGLEQEPAGAYNPKLVIAYLSKVIDRQLAKAK